MGRFEKKKKKSPVKRILICVTVLLLVVVMGLFLIPKSETEEKQAQTEDVFTAEQSELPAVTDQADTVPVTTVPVLEFPLTFDGGKLELEELFQFEGMNPDCGLETGTSIASVTLKNVSEEFLLDASMSLELADGTMLNFCVSNLPAGREVMAFELANIQVEADAVCVQAHCDASWLSGEEALPDAVSVSVSGTTVTIENQTAQEISGLTVYCRDPLDEVYFGGKSHEYTVNNLAANGTATVDALDCILGQADVVRIAIHE